jgi:glycosyltransferase involved in cell wall biosynthesis
VTQNWFALSAPRLLLVSPTDYASALKKGVVALLADFDEGGFFEHVVVAFPFARDSQRARVSPRVVAEDIGTDWMPFGGRWRWLRRAAAPLHIARSVFLLARAVRQQHLDIVRATDPCFSGTLAWLTARLTGRPLCVSIHADFDKRYSLGGVSTGATVLGSRPLARAIEGFVMRRAALVLPIRESLRSYALGLGVNPGRIRIIPHGTDLSGFVEPVPMDVHERFGVPRSHRIVSFAGRLVRENYVHDVMAVARMVATTRDDFTLVVAGGGPEEQSLQAMVEHDPVLRRTVRLVGFQPRDVVAALRRASTVSLCLMGGFSLIEACAAASPVIAYDVEWHGELVQNDRTGFLVPEGDVDGVAAAVLQVFGDRARAQALGVAAQRLALSQHDLRTTIQIKQRCYSELLAAPAARVPNHA